MGKQETNAPSMPPAGTEESEIGPGHPLWERPEVMAAIDAGLDEMDERDIAALRQRFPSLSREDAIKLNCELRHAGLQPHFPDFNSPLEGRRAMERELRDKVRTARAQAEQEMLKEYLAKGWFGRPQQGAIDDRAAEIAGCSKRLVQKVRAEDRKA